MGYSAPFCGSCGFLTAIFLSSILLLVGIHANVLEIDDDAEHPVEETLLEDDDSWSHLVNKRSNSVNEDSFYDLGNLDNNNIAFVDDNDEIEDGNWFYRSIHRLKRSVSDLIAPESKRVRKSKKNKHNKEIAPLLKSSETSVHSKSNKKSKKSINVKPYSELKSKPSSLVKKKNKISSQYDDEEYTDDEDGFDQSGDHVISGSGDGGDMDENSIKTIHYYHVTMYTQDPWYNFYDLTTNHIIELRNRWHEKIERSFIDKPTEIEVLHIDLRNDNGVKAEVYLKAIDGRHSAKLIRNILKESAHGGPLQIFTIDPDRITVVTKEAKDVLSFEEHEEPQSPPLRSPGWNPLGGLAGGSSNSNDDDDDNMVEDYDDASNLDVDNTFETMIPLDNDFTTIEPKMCRGDDQVRCGNSSEHICDVQMCDGNIDCSNGADEENCTSSEVTTPMPTTTAYYCDGFTCDGTRCLNHDQKCDRNYDCSDGSDEENCPIDR